MEGGVKGRAIKEKIYLKKVPTAIEPLKKNCCFPLELYEMKFLKILKH